MTTPRLWLTWLPALLVGCIRDPDPGGQEGEEITPALEDDDVDGGGEDGGESDTGDDGSDVSVDHISGERTHLRGSGNAGDYDCMLVWSLEGTAGADGCPDCTYTFDVTFSLDAESSIRDDYACDDVYATETATLGLMDDYFGYGPAVVGIYEGYPYPYLLGFAWWDDEEVGWSYGYIDEDWWGDGTYYTWFFEVNATLE